MIAGGVAAALLAVVPHRDQGDGDRPGGSLAAESRPVSPTAWVIAAAAVGFASSAVFSSLLRLERAPFVFAHALAVGAFAAMYFRLAHVDPVAECRRRPVAGLLAGVAVGLVLLFGVAGQPGGPAPRGIALLAALGWYTGVYGVADAMLLTVIPVLAVRRDAGASGTGWRGAWRGVAAMAASLLVTALYHFGFEEFRGMTLLQPLIGNAIVTAGYLITRNPMTPLLAHVIMHGAAVVHGMESTAQLPPHY
jgi:hypothetical protein